MTEVTITKTYKKRAFCGPEIIMVDQTSCIIIENNSCYFYYISFPVQC